MTRTAERPATSDAAIASALDTVRTEQDALQVLATALDEPPLREGFVRTVQALAATRGRAIVTGMGKSGIIARKIAATLTSTGTPALFLHPGEASHGDLGMIAPEDVVIALSWSGETTELGDIIAHCRRFGITLVVMTAQGDSTAGRAADIRLVLPPVREACPNQLAPTSSTTIQAVLGDALAIALVRRRGFSRSDFLTLHPGGRLGAQLTAVAQLMGRGEEIPTVRVGASLHDAIIQMSRKRYGATAVVDDDGRLVGVFTDGDLRRSLASPDLQARIEAHMTPRPLAVAPDMLSVDALRMMNAHAVSVLFVCDGEHLVGALHLHDMLRAGVA